MECLVFGNNLKGPYKLAKLKMVCEMKVVAMYGFDGMLLLVLSLFMIFFQVS